MTRANKAGIAALWAAVVLAGCDGLPFGNTPIRDILAAPANFEGKEVRIKGKVTDIMRVPILDVRVYTLRDESGEIIVFTRGDLPAAGDNVALKGTVRSAAIIGGESFGLRVEEKERLR